MIAALYHAAEGTPEPLPSHIPPELVRIVECAMSKDPSERFATAEEFRLALQGFLEHRSALDLVRGADERAAELDALLAAGASEGVVAEASGARFGYSQALGMWPECASAAFGFDRVTAGYAVWSAEQDELATAEGLVSQLSKPDPRVDVAIAAARARLQEGADRLEQLEQLGRDVDVQTGQGVRMAIIGIVLLGAGLLPVIEPFVPWLQTWSALILFPVAAVTILAGLAVYARETISATRINRHGMAVMVVMMAAQFAITFGGWRAGLSMATTMSLVFPLWGVVATSFALMIDRKLWPTGAGFVVASIVVMVRPQWWLVLTSLCNLLAVLNFAYIWRPSEPPSDG